MGSVFKMSLQLILMLSVYPLLLHSASVLIKQEQGSPEFVAQGLYNSSDEVEELTAKNFNQKIYGSNRSWVVEFYNTWCGHCQRYAPTYKKVAYYFKNCKDIIVIAAVDCANEVNQPLCRNFEIMGYPTLRYFHENFVEGSNNLGLPIPKADINDTNGNIKAIFDILISEQKENRAQLFPNLLPYERDDISEIFNSVKPEVRYVFLVLESSNDLLGTGAALAFHNVSNIFITHSSNDKLINYFNVKQLPALIILSRGDDGAVIEEKLQIDNIQRQIATSLKHRGFDVDQVILVNMNQKDSKMNIEKMSNELEEEQLMKTVRTMGDVVFQMDLESALRFSLRQEVGRNKLIEGEKLNALKAYLNVVVKYFPLSRRGHFFLNKLISLVTNSNSVRGVAISTLVKNSEKEDQFIWSSPKKWLGCRGSVPESRGYPCGIWTMFHYITVNAADQNLHMKNADSKEVLMAMHGYIKNFFGCSDCSLHFQNMAKEKRIDQVSSLQKAIMWLWEAHNEVNERLAGDPTEDPQYPKRQFPTVERCPECRYVDGSWNLNQVEKYIKHMYASTNIRYIGSDTKILHMDLEDFPNNSSGSFGSIDIISRCLLLMLLYLGYINTRH